jgi:hypothetical protein
MLIHGALAREMMANMARGVAQARIVPIEVLSRKRG